MPSATSSSGRTFIGYGGTMGRHAYPHYTAKSLVADPGCRSRKNSEFSIAGCSTRRLGPSTFFDKGPSAIALSGAVERAVLAEALPARTRAPI